VLSVSSYDQFHVHCINLGLMKCENIYVCVCVCVCVCVLSNAINYKDYRTLKVDGWVGVRTIGGMTLTGYIWKY
jgi:hypothetical protein